MKPLLILLSVFISFHCQSNEIGKTIDMAHLVSNWKMCFSNIVRA